ncbi:MAG: hypothetical protein AMXMBFR7_16300 [Planctomycetota bacterium]
MTSLQVAQRVTTREAADLFKCEQAQALVLLKAAHIPHDRVGHGQYLWHAEAVLRFAETLAASERAAAPAAVQAQG